LVSKTGIGHILIDFVINLLLDFCFWCVKKGDNMTIENDSKYRRTLEVIMEMSDAVESRFLDPLKYTLPYLIKSNVSGLYSTFRKTSVALATQIREITVRCYDVELLKACFKKPVIEKEPLKVAPEGGDDSGKVLHAYLQRIKSYLSDEAEDILRWSGYKYQNQER